MAQTQSAEIVFAQKLASNEKAVRNKAVVKLRKYISARSDAQQRGGGFSEEELLKIWKGLFYCLWMQDKPLLQEELSTKISTLLHSFRTVDSQFLYFKTFLLTMKREWNGIDRLRMDKFYQLVRFVFREVFEMLKRHDWNSSVVNEFLELISVQLLQSSSSTPSGLILHVLDLYMTELALIGSATLMAEQNQTFIEPFCNSMADTTDRVLLKAIGSSIFNTIVDQVPFAIQDLLREIEKNKGEDFASSEDQMKNKAADDDGIYKTQQQRDLSEDMDVEDDGECGPVLQFDYGVIADRLFQLASNPNIPSFNRSKIYKFVKIFRDLADGVFPQDEVEQVSTDEEDEDDSSSSRRRRKKKSLNKQSQKTVEADMKSSEMTTESDSSKEKKRKKKHSKSVEDQTASEDLTGSDADRPAVEFVTDNSFVSKPQKTHKIKKTRCSGINKEQHKNTMLSSDPSEEQQSSCHLTPVKAVCGSETDISIIQKKKRKLKKKKNTDEEKAGDCSEMDVKEAESPGAHEHTSREEVLSSDPSTVTTQSLKKKKNISIDEPSDVKEKKTMQNMTKKKKIKRAVRSDDAENSEEPDEMHKHTDTSAADVMMMMMMKKKKKKVKFVQLNGDSTERLSKKRNMMNGHTDTMKRHKTLSECKEPADTQNMMTTKGFVFSQKKSPTAIFCRSAGFGTPVCRKQSLTISKSEMKKVTFGLKNNKTMEFRKMDKSFLVSPVGQSRVAFDPKKTPKSGVLKSPSALSSPALWRRSTAADFF